MIEKGVGDAQKEFVGGFFLLQKGVGYEGRLYGKLGSPIVKDSPLGVINYRITIIPPAENFCIFGR